MAKSNEIINCFYKSLIAKKDSIIRLLITIETEASAIDEYDRCVCYIQNILNEQNKYIPNQLSGSAVAYLPLNQPLYSLALGPLTLALSCCKVFYRPPEQLSTLHTKLSMFLLTNISTIHICTISRKQFMLEHTSKADIVVYTGRLENVKEIQEHIRTDALLVYNGSALNPIIVTASADIQDAVTCVIQARLYNSGQDCMAPAAIFIHKTIANTFIHLIIEQLDLTYKHNNKWNKKAIGPMISTKCYKEDIQYLSKWSNNIIYGGIELGDNYLSPTILYFDKYHGETPSILYAPFFSIFEYDNESDIIHYLTTAFASQYKGYISIFGKDVYESIQSYKDLGLITLHNSTLFDYENGNKEFGGYGVACSFVATNKTIHTHPILLLREIADWRESHA